ncbi:MAG TPA: hypothetical protein VI757_03115 [Bacteroidia bacterium]|nr:hypothetical protein [Bacteroidia bacterium]
MNTHNKQSTGEKMRFYFMFFMSFLYIAAGAALLTVWKFESLTDSNRKIIGAVLVAYGIFRIYTLIKRRRQ